MPEFDALIDKGVDRRQLIDRSPGAVAAKPGFFEMADGGTLFIDEIGEMPGSLQAKLLRVLEDGSMRRVGSVKERRVDVRLLAATNRNMLDEVKAGRFREDLYYRINVMSLQLPPLRERNGDTFSEPGVALERLHLFRFERPLSTASIRRTFQTVDSAADAVIRRHRSNRARKRLGREPTKIGRTDRTDRPNILCGRPVDDLRHEVVQPLQGHLSPATSFLSTPRITYTTRTASDW